MSHLAITLFGGFQVELEGCSLTDFGTDKTRLLLAYLALQSGLPHRREALAALFWPDRPEASARNNLRQALHHLRRILGPGSAAGPHLLIAADKVQFNHASDHWVDVLEFDTRLSSCRVNHPAGLNLCPGCMESLQRAIALYQGEMLDGFTLPGCNRFTDWQIFRQETCHRQVLAALTLLSNYFETHLAYDRLIACTQKEIEREPWRETAHRRLMWALAMDGQRRAALRQYEILREVLWRELEILPADETRQLYDRIRQGHLPT